MKDSNLIPWLPFPLAPVSNGEWCPAPPTAKQRQVMRLLHEEAEVRARKLAMSRRDFLRTAAGTATAYMVMNQVYGLAHAGDAAVLPVTMEQTRDPAAAAGLFDAEYFVMDVQLHHVDLERFGNLRSLASLRFLEGNLSVEERLQNLSQANMIKEVWVDSETAVGVISGVPDGVPMGPEVMAETRDMVNSLSGSNRALSQAMIDPLDAPGGNLPIESLERQVKELGAVAVKCYTGNGNARADGWFLDDEEIAYPLYAEAERLGLSMINVHKGFPGISNLDMTGRFVRSRDIPKAAKDWPRLNFVAYHSGYFPGEGNGEFVDVLKQVRGRGNVYAEIGSAFAVAFLAGADQAAHLVGAVAKEIGYDHILWGTDSIWWGSPQFQINALKNLQISAQMQEELGYPPLTDEAKALIFGGNAARLYRVDVNETRNAIDADNIARIRDDLGGMENSRTHYVYGLKTRREFLRYWSRIG
jgi:uncharacterized protein